MPTFQRLLGIKINLCLKCFWQHLSIYSVFLLTVEDADPKEKSSKTLPRPPPFPMVFQEDALDTEGYLLQREMEAVQYLETLPG